MRRAALLLPAMLAACVSVPPPGGAIRPAAMRASARHQPPMPRSIPTAVSVAELLGGGRFPTFAAAIRAAGLGPLLEAPGPVTVFAPGEDAWAHLAPGVSSDLLKPENRPSLVALLRFHLVPGRFTTADLRRRAATGPFRLATLAGEPLTLTLTDNALTLTDATGHRAYITAADEPASNGLVHEVTRLLVPQALGPQP